MRLICSFTIRLVSSLVCLVTVTTLKADEASKPLLLRNPRLNQTDVVFSFAGDLWIVGRNGGEARRLTAGIGAETTPSFSPDGTLVAFTGEYDGNVDVYVMPARGGIPRRLTYHPGPDKAVGWTPDGRRVLFGSARDSYSGVPRLFTISVDGGFPEEVSLPFGTEGSYSPDGSHLAYVPTIQWQHAWKRYRGGQTTPIWIAKLSDSSIEKIPRENSNDFNPMWIGKMIYFLSDRNGPVALFAYDTETKQVSTVVPNDGLDVKSAAAGPGAIVYEQFGSLYLFDLQTHQTKRLEVRIAADLPEVRPHFVKVDVKRIRRFDFSRTGARAVFEARGEILSVPAEKGDVRNLTRTPGVMERDPAFSPDGTKVAYFSDATGEYALEIRDQRGLGEARHISLGAPPSFFYSPTWSPDGKKIAYTDKRLNLWYVTLDTGVIMRVDTDRYDSSSQEISARDFHPVWSPDSRWLAYSKALPSHLHAIHVYSLDKRVSIQITDGMSDARHLIFDKDGKHLYFTASTDIGPAAAWLDLSSMNRPTTSSVYVVVLRKDLPSPLAPESDEEKGEPKTEEKPKADKDWDKGKGNEKTETEKPPSPEPIRLDFENINQRILALPVPAANYWQLEAGKEGVLFLVEAPLVLPDDPGPEGVKLTIHKFTFKDRKADKLLEGIGAFTLSGDGEKMLYRQGDQWLIAPADKPQGGEGSPAKGAIKLGDMEVYIEPLTEWCQMYHEVWRIQRDFLYDPHFHGLDLKAAEKRYDPFLEGLASRADLSYLFEEMLGELTLGHVFVWGGDRPEPRRINGGLLGADYRIENGRYRFAYVYNGENWNPKLRAPLTQPGVNVTAGEYLLAVNGRELKGSDNIYALVEGMAEKSVVLKVGPQPDSRGTRDVTVVPVGSEVELRHLAWIEENRRKVDRMTGGQVAYVYLPNTAGAGYRNFDRYYFAQVGKEAVVIDERFNGGGYLADYIIDHLRRPLMSFVTTREGEDFASPTGVIYGPKIMMINEYAGSGGDALPWYFRKAGLGLLVGKKTWGGLVGIWDYPELMDGGVVTAPRGAIYGLDGEWEVENMGIAPDVEVEFDPKSWRTGHDPQLEKAVEIVMTELRKNPPSKYRKPAYPNYHQGK